MLNLCTDIISRMTKFKLKPLLTQGHADRLDLDLPGHLLQDAARHIRQQGIGQDMVHVAGAGIDLGATGGDGIDQVI